jgi:hypothetical protein
MESMETIEYKTKDKSLFLSPCTQWTSMVENAFSSTTPEMTALICHCEGAERPRQSSCAAGGLFFSVIPDLIRNSGSTKN